VSRAAELKQRVGVPYRKICDVFATYLALPRGPATLGRAAQRLVARALPSDQVRLDA
jgi:hypothetical protein